MFLSIDLIVANQPAAEKPATYQAATRAQGPRYASLVPSPGGVLPDVGALTGSDINVQQPIASEATGSCKAI